jgi:hypothetical protein
VEDKLGNILDRDITTTHGDFAEEEFSAEEVTGCRLRENSYSTKDAFNTNSNAIVRTKDVLIEMKFSDKQNSVIRRSFNSPFTPSKV